jgi:hypothetical protein
LVLHFIRTPELVNIQLVELYPKTEDVGTTSNHLLPIGPRSGVIYSWLFKYTQQHTVGFTENSIGPRTEIIFSWLFKYTQHTAGFTENSIGPPHWNYLLLAVQVHTTTHCRSYREQHWASHFHRSLWSSSYGSWIYNYLCVVSSNPTQARCTRYNIVW